MHFLRRLKNLNDLSIKVSNSEIQSRIYDCRKRVRIAVIDDEQFQPEDNLRRNSYQINVFKDLNTIEDINSYHIVLCDLSGVGTSQNPDLQGAHLIAEIKRAYPEKYIIAYTGGSSDREVYARAKMHADCFVKKDETIDEWVSVLDEAIEKIVNPTVAWKNIRPKLLESDVTPYELAILEDAFVRGLKTKNGSVEKIKEKSESLSLSSSAKSIIASLVSNAIFSIATGGAQ